MMAVLPDLGGILTAGGKMAKVPAKIAEEMAAAGRTQKEIWDETGWWVNTPEGTRVIGDKPLREIVDPPDVAIQKWGAETLTRREAKQAQLDEQQQIADTAERLLSEMKKGRTLEEVAADLQTSNLPDRAKNMVITQVRSGKPQPPNKWDYRILDDLWRGPEPSANRIHHPELYAEHPELAKVPMTMPDEMSYLGQFNTPAPGKMEIEVSTAAPVKYRDEGRPGYEDPEVTMTSTALHELGHGAQHLSDAPRGGSPLDAQFKLRRAYDEGRVGDADYVRLSALSDFDKYQRLGGEALSRLAQKRWMASRGNGQRSPYPWEDLDVPIQDIFW